MKQFDAGNIVKRADKLLSAHMDMFFPTYCFSSHFDV
jgi:hypothetical protein